jgi:hypothetical protein
MNYVETLKALELRGYIFFGSAVSILREVKENVLVEELRTGLEEEDAKLAAAAAVAAASDSGSGGSGGSGVSGGVQEGGHRVKPVSPTSTHADLTLNGNPVRSKSIGTRDSLMPRKRVSDLEGTVFVCGDDQILA